MQIYDYLTNIPHDRLAEKVGGKFRLTTIVARRLNEISSGRSRFLVDPLENEAPIATICREILENKIWLETPQIQAETPENDYDLLGLSDDGSTEF